MLNEKRREEPWERFNTLITAKRLMSPRYSPRLSATLPAVLCAITGGVLYALSNVGFGFWPLVFICFMPLWLAFDHARHTKACALFGFIFGLAVFAVGYPWLFSLTGEFIGGGVLLSGILWSAVAICFAGGFAVYGLLYRRFRKMAWPQALAGTLPLILLEWLQTNLFPSYTGAALISVPILAQIADLGGPLLLSAFVLIINSCLYSVFLHKQDRDSHTFKSLFVVMSLFSMVGLYGYFEINSQQDQQLLPERKALRIGAVQTNLVMLEKSELSLKSHKTHLEQSRELLAHSPVDLLIWPETAYVRGLRRPLPIDAQFIRAEIDVPILFGGTSVWQENGQRASANSVFLANSAGKIEQVYDKNQLIPFAEYFPFPRALNDDVIASFAGPFLVSLEETIKALFPERQEFRPGQSKKALLLKSPLSSSPESISTSTYISTPICYEIIHPEFIREMVNQSHPELIITLANDAWFGDSQEPWIHLSLARLRAIEHQMWVVRATNSGISAIIDPTGQIVARTNLLTKENLTATVYPRRSSTLYTRYGDWVAWLAVSITLTGLLIRLPLPRLSPFFTNR